MPTGYTAGIVDGEIKTFKDFAKNCARAFGATMHMREESLNTPYKPREVIPYYFDAVKEIEDKIKYTEITTPEELVKNEELALRKEIEENLEEISKRKIGVKLIEQILIETKNYTPPTPEHEGIKKFMIEQLETTIQYDFNTNYYEDQNKELEHQLKSLNGVELKSEKLEYLNKQLTRRLESLEEQINLTNESNKWVKDFFDSLG